jgi:short-subunit dehydrogenase
MSKQGSGHIINTGSIEGIMPIKYQAQYNTTKYAVVGLSESIRYEYMDQGIKCSVICPGFVNTSIFKKKMGKDVPEEKKKIIEEAIKKGNPMSPQEVAIQTLERAADGESIIVIPEQPWTKMWQGYILGYPEAQEAILQTSDRIQQIINLEK